MAQDTSEQASQQSRFRLLREDGRARWQNLSAWYRAKWAGSRWFRLANYALGAFLAGWFLL
ncbi:MAG: hypothetical protein VW935_02760, partial [Novosphingobium sp.]